MSFYSKKLSSVGISSPQIDSSQFMLYNIDDHLFGIALDSVKQVQYYHHKTEKPNNLDENLGYTTLFESSVPIMYLKRILKLGSKIPEHNQLIYVNKGIKNYGLLVDNIKNLTRIPNELISYEFDEIDLPVNKKYILGVISIDNDFILILDNDAVLSNLMTQESDSIEYKDQILKEKINETSKEVKIISDNQTTFKTETRGIIADQTTLTGKLKTEEIKKIPLPIEKNQQNLKNKTIEVEKRLEVENNNKKLQVQPEGEAEEIKDLNPIIPGKDQINLELPKVPNEGKNSLTDRSEVHLGDISDKKRKLSLREELALETEEPTVLQKIVNQVADEIEEGDNIKKPLVVKDLKPKDYKKSLKSTKKKKEIIDELEEIISTFEDEKDSHK